MIAIEVDDVDDAARVAEAAGCTVTAEPADAVWGERFVEIDDPFGYAWKFFTVFPDVPHDGLAAVAEQWSTLDTARPCV